MTETISESANALMAIAAVVIGTIILIIGKICWNRREAAKAEMASIEAFSYDEKANNVVRQSEEDVENSSKQSYHNLAGGRPTTPAVF